MVSWVQVDWGWGLGERRMFLAGPVIKSPVNVLSKSPVKHTHTTHTHTHNCAGAQREECSGDERRR